MAKSKGGITVGKIAGIVEAIAEEQGLILWDLRYEKEGASWYLRIIIDKEGGGVSLDDCERLSRAVDGPIEEANPIEQQYFLEVSSPGLERELTKPSHYEMMAGREVSLTLFRPAENGEKEIIATLIGLSQEKTIVLSDLDGVQFEVPKKDVAVVRLYEEI
ncbi:MAG: ribosome maturation factor RimP [Oscillospiraceae bacterium]|jgi:ribosome maturation factor RimP|nr:ribosome maturation factor RimP [Oscillospiraceae bacterium]